MEFLWLGRRAVAPSLAVGVALLMGHPAMSACYSPSNQLPASALSEFTQSPGDILKLSNAELISKVRDLVASSPQALQLVLGLIHSANPAQVSAIGTGLGDSALICVRSDQAFATEIQNAIAGAGNSTLTLAFAAVLGDKPIGAVGASGGGGGFSSGAGGGPVNPTTSGFGGPIGGATTFSTFFTKNTGFNYFTSSLATAPSATGSSSTTFIISTVTSVSPTR